MPTLADIARGYATDPLSWPVRPCFDPVQRWYHRISRDRDHEAWLLTWLPGQGTDLHDHGGAAGAFIVISGVLTEETVSGAVRPRLYPQRLDAGRVRQFGARHVHRVTNNGTEPAVSLHIYSPALREIRRYDLDHLGLRLATVELAGRDW